MIRKFLWKRHNDSLRFAADNYESSLNIEDSRPDMRKRVKEFGLVKISPTGLHLLPQGNRAEVFLAPYFEMRESFFGLLGENAIVK